MTLDAAQPEGRLTGNLRSRRGLRFFAIGWFACTLGFSAWPSAASIAQPLGKLAPLSEPLASTSQDMAARFFVLSQSCARCHTAVATSSALWNEAGEDASPVGTWQASVMANSFRDPYWRAQIEREIAVAPIEKRSEISALCTRCHAPAAVHEARFEGQAPPSLAQLDQDPAAAEGVTCTICHRMTGEGLGTPATFDGHLPLDFQNRLYGPYREPFDGPMAAMSGYQVQFGQHTVESSLCATCHTLETQHGGAGSEAGTFLEQSPYLEWRNSVFSTEDSITDESRTCQSCHMPQMGSMTLAHNPGGRDFPFLTERDGVRSHAIVGGNALLLDMLAAGREELGVTASVEALAAMAQETRQQLAEQAAHIEIGDLDWRQDRLSFAVFVENLTGHKLPTGYPSRRVWLEVQVRTGIETWFASGVPDAAGRILEPGKGFLQPHHDRITASDQVQIYELVARDESGQATTQLSAMRSLIKDNRLLPKGWRLEGPHGKATAPAGLGADKDFVGSLDRVQFDLEIPAELRSGAGRPRIQARLLYQSIPPAWADDHRAAEGETPSPAAARFLKLYDAAPTRYEVLAESMRIAR